MLLFWALCGEDTHADESPLEVIRTTTKKALAVVDNSSSHNTDNPRVQRRKMWEVILPHFDQRAIAQRALGFHWQDLSEQQRARFTQLFINLVKNSYSGTLDRYSKDAQFFFDSERVEGDYAEVYTRIKTPTQPEALTVVYRLHRRNGQWLVYDVIAANVSMVRNYRNQFYRILNRSSFDELIQKLQDKLQALARS